MKTIVEIKPDFNRRKCSYGRTAMHRAGQPTRNQRTMLVVGKIRPGPNAIAETKNNT